MARSELPFHHGHGHGHSHGVMGLSTGRLSQWLCRLPAFALLATVLGALYAYALYTDAVDSLLKAQRRTESLAQSEDSLKAQLQVIYEHKTRLERNIEKIGAERDQEQATLHRQLTEKQRIITELSAERDHVRQQNDVLSGDLDALKREQSDVELDGQRAVSNLTRSLEEARSEATRLNGALEACESSVRQLRSDAAALRLAASRTAPQQPPAAVQESPASAAPGVANAQLPAAVQNVPKAPARRGPDRNIVEFVRRGPMDNVDVDAGRIDDEDAALGGRHRQPPPFDEFSGK